MTDQQKRSIWLDELACEQAIINDANETDMDDTLAAEINRASFRTKAERSMFKNAYRRHVRNLADGNRFYSL
jgi:hypothetical protein